MNAGIYVIICQVNHKFYIGSSINIEKRFIQHKYHLNKGSHCNQKLQNAWNKYGQKSFIFEKIKSIDTQKISRECLFLLEETFIKIYNPEFNVGPVAGGDTITNHPYRKDIIKKINNSKSRYINSLSTDDRKEKWGKTKDKNNNWKGGISNPICSCGKTMSYGSKMCMSCYNSSDIRKIKAAGRKLSQSTKNKISKSSRGKKLSQSTKDKISKANSGRKMSQDQKDHLSKIMRETIPGKNIEINGVVYKSIREASRTLSIDRRTIGRRIKNKNFTNYKET